MFVRNARCKDKNDKDFISMFIFSVHVSGDYVPIIRRNNCIYATLGSCHLSANSRPYRVTSTKCRINTLISHDDGHIVDRHM